MQPEGRLPSVHAQLYKSECTDDTPDVEWPPALNLDLWIPFCTTSIKWMLFFSLAENTLFSSQGSGVTEGTVPSVHLHNVGPHLNNEHREEGHTLNAQWHFGQACFWSRGSLAGRKDSAEGRGGPGNLEELTSYPCYANRRKSPPGSHLTFSCLPPPAYFFLFQL